MKYECFYLPNPSSRNVALWFIQPVTKLSTRNFSESKSRPVRKTDNITAICDLVVYKL
jgi:hypothetical protein